MAEKFTPKVTIELTEYNSLLEQSKALKEKGVYMGNSFLDIRYMQVISESEALKFAKELLDKVNNNNDLLRSKLSDVKLGKILPKDIQY